MDLVLLALQVPATDPYGSAAVAMELLWALNVSEWQTNSFILAKDECVHRRERHSSQLEMRKLLASFGSWAAPPMCNPHTPVSYRCSVFMVKEKVKTFIFSALSLERKSYFFPCK